jgi:hypothetical protein
LWSAARMTVAPGGRQATDCLVSKWSLTDGPLAQNGMSRSFPRASSGENSVSGGASEAYGGRPVSRKRARNSVDAAGSIGRGLPV